MVSLIGGSKGAMNAMNELSQRASAIGWAIKTFRTRPGVKITQMVLADKAKIPFTRISYIETGRSVPTDADLRSIAKALKCTTKDILNLANSARSSLSVGRES